MRNNLKAYEGRRMRWVGIISEFSYQIAGLGRDSPIVTKKLGNLRTVCLARVKLHNGTVIQADHVWIRYTGSMMKLKLERGDALVFDATVMAYWKGRLDYDTGENDRHLDYTLMAPVCVAVLTNEDKQRQWHLSEGTPSAMK